MRSSPHFGVEVELHLCFTHRGELQTEVNAAMECRVNSTNTCHFRRNKTSVNTTLNSKT